MLRKLTLTVVLLLTVVLGGTTGQAAQASKQRSTIAWPPHHQLWLCIHHNEASDWHTSNNGIYRGGLQLHQGWGYGTSNDASLDSQLVQEWGAEYAWRASHQSMQSFASGQWLRWDGAYYCLSYA